jgi:hypothetical protein
LTCSGSESRMTKLHTGNVELVLIQGSVPGPVGGRLHRC